MSADDPYGAVLSQPPSRVVPSRTEPLFVLRRGDAWIACELRYHGEHGVSACLSRNGIVVFEYRHPTRERAVAFAEAEREAWLARGYEREP